MPVYTYRREDGTTFDIRQKFSDDALDICPTTGQSVQRVVQAAGIIFKGSGFYVNDSKGKNSANTNGKSNGATAEKTDSTPATGGDAKADSTSTTSESKTAETKTDSKVTEKKAS